MQKILFATDGSDASKKAGKMAESFLDAYPEARLIVLHVIKPVYLGEGLGFSTQTEADAVDQFAEEVKEEAKKEFGSYQGRVQILSEYGPPAMTICDVADRESVDLILVGSHGRGAVDRLLLGSVSHGVIHRARVPVLVVK